MMNRVPAGIPVSEKMRLNCTTSPGCQAAVDELPQRLPGGPVAVGDVHVGGHGPLVHEPDVGPGRSVGAERAVADRGLDDLGARRPDVASDVGDAVGSAAVGGAVGPGLGEGLVEEWSFASNVTCSVPKIGPFTSAARMTPACLKS